MKFNFYLLLIFSISLSSCIKDDYVSSEDYFIPEYSFFTAGHVYGHPDGTQLGFHPPMQAQIPFLNDYPTLMLGILTGDVVRQPTQELWDPVLDDINSLDVPIHIAAGNHDRGEIFASMYDYYHSFKQEDDLFIVLSPTSWNIEGEQEEFFRETIQTNADSVNNIFIFCHELIWWSPYNQFAGVDINWEPHFPGITNYWKDINPFLDSLNNNVVIYAGDLGASEQVSPYMYYRNDNITLIGSGMGGGMEDNIMYHL